MFIAMMEQHSHNRCLGVGALVHTPVSSCRIMDTECHYLAKDYKVMFNPGECCTLLSIVFVMSSTTSHTPWASYCGC